MALVPFALVLLGVQAGKPVTLRVGQGVRLSSGKVTKGRAGADLLFGVQAPESTSGNRYNVATGQFEYQAGITTSASPKITASRVGTFDSLPTAKMLASDPIEKWGTSQNRWKTGSYVVVRALTSGKDYVLRVTKLTMPKHNPSTWRVSFTYAPLTMK